MPEDQNDKNGKRKPYKKRAWQADFLAELEETNCIKKACVMAMIGRTTYEVYSRAHPEFLDKVRVARLNAVDDVEATVHERCKHGDKITRFDREGTKYIETVYPDMLIVRYLQANRPEKWRVSHLDPDKMKSPNERPKIVMLPALETAEQ